MMTVQEAAGILGGECEGADACFTGVSIDSRTLAHGDLFVALTGPTFDGHDFIAEVGRKGAAAALVQRDRKNRSGVEIPRIEVENTRLALGKLASYWRKRFPVTVIAVTGSNGKTTVKEMVASILRCAAGIAGQMNGSCEVLATEGNLNNDIGMPLMLLRLKDGHRYAVMEMGMNHAGEIAYLTHLAKPDVAVITNAGEAHVEGLGSVEAVARAKGEIFEGLDQQGIAVINADDPYASLWHELAGDRRVIDFGLENQAKVSARYQAEVASTRMMLILPGGSGELILQVPGEHNVRNALAAAAVGVALDLDIKSIVAGLAAFGGVKGRMQRKNGRAGSLLIDDTYNANPDSVRAALAVLARARGEKILVLGDMGELGADAGLLHVRIGREARAAGVDKLLTLGELSARAAEQFGRGASHSESIDELLVEVEKLLEPGVTLLIKGSRFMQMERVVRSIES